jgi:hypothetical protein
LKTSIQESYPKYDIAGWLEEIGRCHISFKVAGLPDHMVQHANAIASNYEYGYSIVKTMNFKTQRGEAGRLIKFV